MSNTTVNLNLDYTITPHLILQYTNHIGMSRYILYIYIAIEKLQNPVSNLITIHESHWHVTLCIIYIYIAIEKLQNPAPHL